MSDTIPLNCHQCGAPIEIDVDQKQCLCAHCGTSNVVVRTTGGVVTSATVAGDAAARRQLEAIRLEDELARIDREWRSHRLRYRFARDDSGEFIPPTREGVRSTCTVMVVVGLGLAVIGLLTETYLLAIGGVGFAALVGYSYFHGRDLAEHYVIAERGYRLRRSHVVARLQALTQPTPTPAESDPTPLGSA